MMAQQRGDGFSSSVGCEADSGDRHTFPHSEWTTLAPTKAVARRVMQLIPAGVPSFSAFPFSRAHTARKPLTLPPFSTCSCCTCTCIQTSIARTYNQGDGKLRRHPQRTTVQHRQLVPLCDEPEDEVPLPVHAQGPYHGAPLFCRDVLQAGGGAPV